MTDSQKNTLQAVSVTPSLTVDNVQQSIDFFAGLGFEVEERWENDGVLLGVMLKAGEARIGLSQDDGKKGRARVRRDRAERLRADDRVTGVEINGKHLT